jgi:hypothetical protein
MGRVAALVNMSEMGGLTPASTWPLDFHPFPASVVAVTLLIALVVDFWLGALRFNCASSYCFCSVRGCDMRHPDVDIVRTSPTPTAAPRVHGGPDALGVPRFDFSTNSDANFFCAQPARPCASADTAGGWAVDLSRLRALGIMLRHTTSFGLPGHVRLSVQPPAAQDALGLALQTGSR